jgi:cellulose synthase/poly-beta-1,6-N-acetylglucosamine synthase-like glycosyltransferase
MVSGFTPETGMVGGFTLLSNFKKSADGFFTQVQNIDWIYLLSVGAGAAGLRKPVSILGNNFGFRRAVYDAVGGYRRLGFSIIEDCALMNAMVRQTKWRVRFLLEPGAVVLSLPPLSWRAFIDQRKRWSAGGKEVSVFGKALLVAGFLRHLSTIAAFVFIQPIAPVLAVALIAALADFLLLWSTTGRLRRRNALLHFPLFEIYFFLYSFLFAPVVALPTTVRWKNVDYHWRFGKRVYKIKES